MIIADGMLPGGRRRSRPAPAAHTPTLARAAGMHKPVALVGVAEKGWALVDLEVNVTGGHASMPAKESSVGILANAVAKLEANQMPASFDGPARSVGGAGAPAMRRG